MSDISIIRGLPSVSHDVAMHQLLSKSAFSDMCNDRLHFNISADGKGSPEEEVIFLRQQGKLQQKQALGHATTNQRDAHKRALPTTPDHNRHGKRLEERRGRLEREIKEKKQNSAADTEIETVRMQRKETIGQQILLQKIDESRSRGNQELVTHKPGSHLRKRAPFI